MKGMNAAISMAASSMLAHAWGVAVIAHNIANINTAGFSSRRALYACGPHGQGAELYSVDIERGPESAAHPDDAHIIGRAHLDETGASPPMETSNVDLAREMARLISTASGFRANAHVVSIQESIHDCLLDLKV